MRSSILAAALALVAPTVLAAAGQSAINHADSVARDLVSPPLRSRHATRDHRTSSELSSSPLLRKKAHTMRRRKCSSGKSRNSNSSSADTVEGSQNNSTSSSGNINWDVGSNFLKVGNIFAGFLPDDGSGGGQKESMSQINAVLPAKSAWYGIYAQVSKGKIFDGSQLYGKLDDVKQSGAILAASVMPYGTWEGLTESDNHNAVAIAKVCADIYKNHGIEVWLRFGHEMNWYQTDGTYSGGVSDFQTGWKVLSQAIEQYAPDTKLWWSPNIGSDADYEKYWPKEGRVDVVGFDWYPNSASESFYDKAKPFHDKYTANGAVMVQGETGLHYSGSDAEKMQWVASLSNEKAQSLKNYMGWMWFNYDKFENGQRIDFKIIKNSGDSITSKAVSFFSA